MLQNFKVMFKQQLAKILEDKLSKALTKLMNEELISTVASELNGTLTQSPVIANGSLIIPVDGHIKGCKMGDVVHPPVSV